MRKFRPSSLTLRLTIASLLIFSLLCCETEPVLPQFAVELSPKKGAVEGGQTLKISCRKSGLDKSAYEFSCTHKSDCPLKMIEDKGFVVTWEVDPDCLGGKASFVVTAKNEAGESRREVSVALAQKIYPKEVLPARPSPTPSSWRLIDPFDAANIKTKDNGSGGVLDTWTFRSGKCKMSPGPDETLKIDYRLPLQMSQCGFVEHLQVKKTETKKKNKKGERIVKETYEAIDLSKYKAITFQIKSGDEQRRKLQLEIVDLDPLNLNGQGNVYTSDEILVAKPYWRRYEFPVKDLPKGLKIAAIRSIGFKIDGRHGFGVQGSVLFDNLALIE